MVREHFDRQTWESFTVGRLSREDHHHLLGHLQEECEVCEGFFSELDQDEFRSKVINVADRMYHEDAAPVEPDRSVRAAIFTKVVDGLGRRSSFFRVFASCRSLALSAIVLAAVVTVAAFGLMNMSWPGQGTQKSNAGEMPSIFLQVAVLKHNSDAPERGMKGAKYVDSDILFFRYEIRTSSYVYLVRVNGDSMEVIHSPDPKNPVPQKEGVYDFREGDQAQGFDLSGLEGRQVFVAIASAGPLDLEKDIKPMLRRYIESGSAPFSDNLAIDSFEMTVVKPRK